MTDPYGGTDLFSHPEEPDEDEEEILEDEVPSVYTVSELTAAIRGILEMNFDSVWLEGELSGHKVAQSKHAYFNLKDDRCQIRCVMFRGARSGLPFEPEDGDQVLVSGRVAVYEARGEYQIIVDSMEPRGLGALQKAFDQLKKKLDAEGLFDEQHKKPLPEFPWKIGVVTSPTGAVIRDILNVLKRRNPKVSVLLNPVKVQGEGAAQEIAQAIAEMNARSDLDLLIVGRGGGSIEDLWAFNEEIVARAIFQSRIPVISAVGHEVDVTIADFVADLRAPTPSAAAEIAVPVLDEVLNTLGELNENLLGHILWTLQDRRARLLSLIDRRFFREPRRILENPAQRLDDLSGRLQRSLHTWSKVSRDGLISRVKRLFSVSPEKKVMQLRSSLASQEQLLGNLMTGRIRVERGRLDVSRLQRSLENWTRLQREGLVSRIKQLLSVSPEKKISQQRVQFENRKNMLAHFMTGQLRLERSRLNSLERQLQSLSPLKVLGRGYSLTTDKETGKVVFHPDQVKPGDSLRIRLAEGELDATVEDG